MAILIISSNPLFRIHSSDLQFYELKFLPPTGGINPPAPSTFFLLQLCFLKFIDPPLRFGYNVLPLHIGIDRFAVIKGDCRYIVEIAIESGGFDIQIDCRFSEIWR